MSKLTKVDFESGVMSPQKLHVFDVSFTTKRHTELKHRKVISACKSFLLEPVLKAEIAQETLKKINRSNHHLHFQVHVRKKNNLFLFPSSRTRKSFIKPAPLPC